MKYKEFIAESGSIFICRNNEDGTISFIPKNGGSSDYETYLRWLENPEAEEAQSLQIVVSCGYGRNTYGDHTS